MGTVIFGRIAQYPDDGSYWVVDGQPVHFNPPALTVERVRQNYSQAQECKRLTGAQWMALVKVLEDRRRPGQGAEALAEAVAERVAIQTEPISADYHAQRDGI